LNEKFTHNLSFTYHQYYQKFINIRRDREGNNPQPFILEAGPFKYFDLGYTLKYRLLNNLMLPVVLFLVMLEMER